MTCKPSSKPMTITCAACLARLPVYVLADTVSFGPCRRCLLEAARAGMERAAMIADDFAGKMAISYHRRGLEKKPNGVAGCKADAGVSIAAAIREAAKEPTP